MSSSPRSPGGKRKPDAAGKPRPKTGTKARSKAKAGSKARTRRNAKAKPKAKAKTRSKTKARVRSTAKAGTGAKAKVRAKAKAKTKGRAKAKPAGRRPARLRVTTVGGDELSFRARLPLLPLRDVVIFPGMIVPLLVGRPASVAAVQRGLAEDKFFAVITQRDPQDPEPEAGGLYRIGTVVRAVQVLRVPDGTLKVLVEGIARFRCTNIAWADDYQDVAVHLMDEPVVGTPGTKALVRGVMRLFQEYVTLNHRIPDEMVNAVESLEDPEAVAYVVAGHLLVDLDVRQALLSEPDVPALLKRLTRVLGDELGILHLERKIEGEVRTRVSKGQKEYYLQEQLRAIRKELGESLGDEDHDGEDLRGQVERAGMPKAVKEKALQEVERMRRMSPMSPEATVVRSYVETLLSLPWKKRTRDRLDLTRAAQILDEDHYGLDKVKDRILEYLAVVKLVKRPRGSILCLVGPPGVGKTSLGRSVARALGRQFVRVALGGVRDEAEIRGHRRTYIGSMPGRIIQGLKRAGTKNPVFL
ncbi:LON peptidase substrate-binding domain-containing protein, partial [bacterium]|nr:LON peptidase substrate-binding domain-containing protein [bacterium]